jgi:uncharacterized protein
MKRIFVYAFFLFTVIIAFPVYADSNWIAVSGDSEITVDPDELHFVITIRTWDKEIDNAKANNDEKLEKVKEIFNLFSIPPENLEASSFNVKPIYEDGWQGTDLKGYDIVRSINVKMSKLDQYEDIVDALLNAGIYRISNVRYHSTKKEEIFVEAREKALEKAFNKATHMVKVYEMKLGKPLEISEGNIGFLPFGMAGEFGNVALGDLSVGGDGNDIMGKAKIKASVTVKFELIE